jgi:hypothetical protein
MSVQWKIQVFLLQVSETIVANLLVQFSTSGWFGLSGCANPSNVNYYLNGNKGADGVLCCDNNGGSLAQVNSKIQFTANNQIIIQVFLTIMKRKIAI